MPMNPYMSVGKRCSQVCHASFMALEKQRTRPGLHFDDNIGEWKRNGMCVIVLQCETPLELMGISRYLDQWKIPNHLYIDEGITEVSMGTPTSLATGILTEDQFWMLEQLDLFGKKPDAQNIIDDSGNH